MAASKDLAGLEQLIDLLISEQPDAQEVESSMKTLGLEYSADPVSQLETAMTALMDLTSKRREKINEANL